MLSNHRILKNVFAILKIMIMALIAFHIYETFFRNILTKQIHIFSYILFWIFTTYVLLPKLIRQLTKLYVPDYFIGRTKTIEGLLGDPVNLAFYGSQEDIIEAFENTQWCLADPLNIKSATTIVTHTLLGKPYKHAPVSNLYLFNKKQELAFELEVGNSPRKRHHIRFWKTPDDFHLPGGRQVDWLAAATFDDNVGLSLFTGQVTHKIDADVDKERNQIIKTLQQYNPHIQVEEMKYFTDSYRSRNGGGDVIYTDGSLLIVKFEKAVKKHPKLQQIASTQKMKG